MKRAKVILKNKNGLHARPANIFSKTAMKLKSDLKMYKNNDESNIFQPKSIISILTMGAIKGDELTIIAEGIDEEEAIRKLTEILESEE